MSMRRSLALAIACGLMPLMAMPAQSREAFRLTSNFDGTGGGGCVGEESIFLGWVQPGPLVLRRGEPTEVTALVPVRANGRHAEDPFIRTVGCGADRIVISIDDRGHMLEDIQMTGLGEPVRYVNNEVPGAPTVLIRKLRTLNRLPFPETECEQVYSRVEVRVTYKQSTRTVRGVAVAGCP
jgi:hypothetical protein